MPTYKILPHANFRSFVDLAKPIGSYTLTRGLDLAALDNLAMEALNRDKLHNLKSQDWSEIEDLARACNNGADIGGLLRSQVYELAIAQINKSLLIIVDNLTLHLLADVKADDEDTYIDAAIKLATKIDLNNLGNQPEASVQIPLEYAVSKIKGASTDELSVLSQQQSGLSDDKILQLPFGLIKMWAVKRVMEERYSKAKIMVLRILAEERLRKDQAEVRPSRREYSIFTYLQHYQSPYCKLRSTRFWRLQRRTTTS